MAVTMQQIADLAGVSRGTVDRALNDRGRIRPEVAEKIKVARGYGDLSENAEYDAAKDEQGEMVVSKLNEEMLSKIAETTGGAYVRATKQDIGLDEIVREINDMERSELSTVRFEEFNEQYQYLLLAALVLLLAEFLVLDRRNPLLAHLNIFREPERKEPGL